ncbi:pentapeptide repeat-containing protein [Dongia mobilis]|uniref:pentapeptide repeat-containing protein n=1 Tax=Dongia mobilis TaxID=578943 RepID=UPI0014152423
MPRFGEAIFRQAVFRQAVFRQAVFRQAVFRQAVFRQQHQARDALAPDQVALDDLFRILDRVIGVPDALRIDDEGGTEFAAVEAARLVDAQIAEAEFLGARLHVVPELLRAAALAAAAGVACRSLVDAAEDMGLVIGCRIARPGSVRHGATSCCRCRR